MRIESVDTKTMMRIEPVELSGEIVRLQPLRIEHLPELWRAARDRSLWRWTANRVETVADLCRYVETALNEQQRGVSLPFATVEKSSSRVVGSTRFGNIDWHNRRAEIGWTWINPQWQRTAINTEAKFLMLRHAFEIWRCVRVELKTDVLNEKSRNAILRLGAKEEGVLRQHLITDSGRLRDTVYFSIIDSEWAAVKENLLAKLNERRSAR